MKQYVLWSVGIAVTALFLTAGCWLFMCFHEKPYEIALHRLRHAMLDYRVQHNAWPSSLDDLPDQGAILFENTKFEYNPTNLQISLSLSIPKNSVLYTLSGGLFGSQGVVCGISTQLAETTNGIAEPKHRR